VVDHGGRYFSSVLSICNLLMLLKIFIIIFIISIYVLPVFVEIKLCVLLDF